MSAGHARAADASSAQALGQALGANLSWDPLTGSGFFEKEGRYASFVEGQPLLVLDFRDILSVSAPYRENGKIMCSPEFSAAVGNHLLPKKAAGDAKYHVSAILIDPGHGGKDPGAIADLGGSRLYEKDITLEVSKTVSALLAERYPSRRVLVTREGDSYPSLEERVGVANSTALAPNEAVIYVSIHANASFNKNAKGFEVWYLNPEYRRTVVDATTVKEKGQDIAPIINAMLEEEFTTESIILARKVYDRLGRHIGGDTLGRGIRAEEWFVVRNAKMPSILIEIGFMTNPDEGPMLSDSGYLRRIGNAIYNGIVDFIEHFER